MRWDLWNPKIIDAIDRMVFDFCNSTLETSEHDTDKALELLRQDLKEGVKQGDAYADLSRRVGKIFLDPQRAAVIAQTEGSRAVNGGAVIAAQESDVVTGKEWLASSDACDVCLSYAAMGVIPLDEPFAVIDDGVYGTIMHAPAHPSCFCSVTFSID